MQTNLTLMDLLLALLVGIVGSIVAAYLFRNGPIWFERATALWAERSKYSAEKRIAKLNSELKQLELFEAHPANFIGWCAMMLGRALGAFTTSLVAILFGLSTHAAYLADRSFAKLDPTFVCCQLHAWLDTIVTVGSASMSGFIFAYAYGIVGMLVAYQNFAVRRKSMEAEIATLRARFGT
jgi:uncharacterized membrane protein YeaQ/YmgE (transglycosylase-associated protein family)